MAFVLVLLKIELMEIWEIKNIFHSSHHRMLLLQRSNQAGVDYNEPLLSHQCHQLSVDNAPQNATWKFTYKWEVLVRVGLRLWLETLWAGDVCGAQGCAACCMQPTQTVSQQDPALWVLGSQDAPQSQPSGNFDKYYMISLICGI